MLLSRHWAALCSPGTGEPAAPLLAKSAPTSPQSRQPRAPALSATTQSCVPALSSPAPAGGLRPRQPAPGREGPSPQSGCWARNGPSPRAGSGWRGRHRLGAEAAARGASGTGSGAWYLGVLLSQLLVLPLQLRGGRHGPASSGRTRARAPAPHARQGTTHFRVQAAGA